MKASKLLKIIRKELKDYPIEYLRNKVTDDRYRDPLVKKLAKYNSEAYDEIYSLEIKDDFDAREFTKYLSLYLALIAKKPLHPYSENRNDEVYEENGSYYCKTRIKAINDKRSLCKYCVCKNLGYFGMF